MTRLSVTSGPPPASPNPSAERRYLSELLKMNPGEFPAICGQHQPGAPQEQPRALDSKTISLPKNLLTLIAEKQNLVGRNKRKEAEGMGIEETPSQAYFGTCVSTECITGETYSGNETQRVLPPLGRFLEQRYNLAECWCSSEVAYFWGKPIGKKGGKEKEKERKGKGKWKWKGKEERKKAPSSHLL